MLEIQTTINEKGVFADNLAKERIAEELQKYKGKTVTIKITGRKISGRQYGYLHSVIYPIINKQYIDDKVDDGRGWDNMHDVFCMMFLPKKEIFNPITGDSLGERQTTTRDCDMREMAMQFMQNVIDWAAKNMNLTIPPPDKNWRKNKTFIISQ